MTTTTTAITGSDKTAGRLTTYHVTYFITRAAVYEVEAEPAEIADDEDLAFHEGCCIDEGDISELQHFETVEAEPAPPDDSHSLVAAAPDLLDALKELVERDRADAAECGFTDDEMTWLDDARRAIAKAKGGAA